MADDDWERRRAERDAARRAAILALPVVRLRQHARIVAPQAGDVRVATSVGPAGELIALWSAAEDRPVLSSTTTQPGWATFPDARGPRPVGTRVTTHAPDMTVVARIAELPVAFPLLQPLPDGRVLVVGSRCRLLSSGPDLNAIVYDADGNVLIERTLGDGIEHVLATRDGEVWVGFFDEGVYGNFGWGEQDGAAPLGAYGLTRLSADLTPAWQYPSHVDNTWGEISDCYALNVDGDTAWACYYTDFPVVRIHDDTVAGWRSTISGVRALAVAGSRVALFGGYGPDRDRLVVAEFGPERLRVTAQYRLVRPDGAPLPRETQVIGRGADLHVLVDDDWLRLDLDQLN